MNFGEEITPETPEEIADYEAMYNRKREKEETAEPKISFVETGKIELNIRVPNIFPSAVIPIVRDLRKTLENCASLNLLNEFAETRTVEYEEVLIEGAE